MRLFVAVDPSPEVYSNLQDLLDTLRRSATLRWSRPEGLHITLKFIGEWPENRLPDVSSALAGLQIKTPFTVQVAGLGFFPNDRSPRVFWAGVEAPAGLASLAGEVERALEPLGIEREKWKFAPHLTLARIPLPGPLPSLHRAIKALSSQDFGSFIVDCFHLYRSRLSPSGSTYIRLETFGAAQRGLGGA